MAIYTGTATRPGIVMRFPTRTEVRAMLFSDRRVVLAAIVAGTLIILAFIAALTFLAWQDRGTEALTVALVTPVVGVLVSILQRVKATETKIDALPPSTVDGP